MTSDIQKDVQDGDGEGGLTSSSAGGSGSPPVSLRKQSLVEDDDDLDYWNEMNFEVDSNFLPDDIFDINPAKLWKDKAKQQAIRVKGRLDKIRKSKEPPMIKLRDKFTYLFGVASIMVMSYVLGAAPEKFVYLYTGLALILMPYRLITYRKLKWHYFMFDFCYFANILVMLVSYCFPDNAFLFKSCFSFSTGPLPIAILAWRNSFVFHSMDKTTSVFIHMLPPLQMYCMRWYMSDYSHLDFCSGSEPESCEAGFLDLTVYPMSLYIIWQTLYYVKTEIISAEKVQRLGYVTSSSWMLGSESSIVGRVTKGIESRQLKVFVFMMVQFLYTFITLLPMLIVWRYRIANEIFVLCFMAISIWNGGNFYIEVFSMRYTQELLKRQGEQDAAS